MSWSLTTRYARAFQAVLARIVRLGSVAGVVGCARWKPMVYGRQRGRLNSIGARESRLCSNLAGGSVRGACVGHDSVGLCIALNSATCRLVLCAQQDHPISTGQSLERLQIAFCECDTAPSSRLGKSV